MSDPWHCYVESAKQSDKQPSWANKEKRYLGCIFVVCDVEDAGNKIEKLRTWRTFCAMAWSPFDLKPSAMANLVEVGYLVVKHVM